LKLVIFDLDGTLANTMQADEECFVQALSDVFGFKNINTDWSAYRHATDSGILHELFESRLNRVPSQTEVRQFQNQFVELLKKSTQNFDGFELIAGVEILLNELAYRKDFGVALATGGWKISAEWKLKTTKLNFQFHAAAFADDGFSREGIMEYARQQALKHYQQTQFDSVTYFGDDVWDVRASKNLGYHFVGIGSEARAERLRNAGAKIILPNYLEMDSFIQILEL
jgi:phosphoglycolate phosphatase-like HAD superfamily hydrolase